jgi:arylformamidase
MRKVVFMKYDQGELDTQYNNREQRPGDGFSLFVENCQQLSCKARSSLNSVLDVVSGPNPSERLDIFMPAKARDAPVNVFFHGGYWRASSKEDFSYVALGSVPAGVVTVVVNYDLIPNVAMDELIRQCQRSVIWTFRNIRKYGGDPLQIYISGHSAGAHIVSMLMTTCWNEFDSGLPPEMFAGACAISGIYDLEPVRRSFLNATLELTERDVAAFSSIRLAPPARCPLLCAVGANESAEFIRQSGTFARRWGECGLPIQYEIVPGKDHFSIREDLSDPAAPMSKLMLGHMQAALQHSREV